LYCNTFSQDRIQKTRAFCSLAKQRKKLYGSTDVEVIHTAGKGIASSLTEQANNHKQQKTNQQQQQQVNCSMTASNSIINKKKVYESRGGGGGGGRFVRRIGGIFSSSTTSSSSRTLNSYSSDYAGGSGDYIGGGVTGGAEGRWRPRKKEFERLDEGGDEDSFLHEINQEQQQHDASSKTTTGGTGGLGLGGFITSTTSTSMGGGGAVANWPTIRNVFSTESDAGEYKREIMYERKRKAIRQQMEATKTQKQDWKSFSIQPSKRDLTGSATKTKKTTALVNNNTTHGGGHHYQQGQEEEMDPFTSLALTSSNSYVDEFGFQQQQQDDEEQSRHTTTSRQTSSTKHTFSHRSHQTASSDPTDFFSRDTTVKLTSNNLARMEEAMNEEVFDGRKTNTNAAAMNNNNKSTFYQFALDSDRESTVVESTVEVPMSYSQDDEDDFSGDDDEMTEASEGVASTQIQVRAPKPTLSMLKGQSFFSEKQNPQSLMADDGFGSFSTFKAERGRLPVSSARPGPSRGQQQSTHSLAYSPSPVHQNVSRHQQEAARSSNRDARFPLSPLSNLKSFGKSKSNSTVNGQRPKGLWPSPRVPSSSTINDNNDVGKKPDPDEAWIGFQANSQHGHSNHSSRPDPVSNFNPFDDSTDIQSTEGGFRNSEFFKQKKKRDPSISHIVEARFTNRNGNENRGVFENFENNGASAAIDPFRKIEITDEDAWGTDNVFGQIDLEDTGSSKENSSAWANHTRTDKTAPNKMPVTAVPSSDLVPKHRQPLIRGDSEDYEEDESVADDDSFASIALWERSGAVVPSNPIGIKTFPSSSRRTSNSSTGGSINSSRHRRYIDDDDDRNESTDDEAQLDNTSKSSRRSSIAGGSYTKPLALPSNAIMASMLFQKHYNIDQTDVENKLKAKEEEYSKNQKSRNGDIPDSVHADHDYLTTVSSFSDATPTTFSDAWKKPSRDLLHYFSSARTLDMDSKAYLAKSQTRPTSHSALFEA
jgi:hypothetical protein